MTLSILALTVSILAFLFAGWVYNHCEEKSKALKQEALEKEAKYKVGEYVIVTSSRGYGEDHVSQVESIYRNSYDRILYEPMESHGDFILDRVGVITKPRLELLQTEYEDLLYKSKGKKK